jgi:hypothetical protein
MERAVRVMLAVGTTANVVDVVEGANLESSLVDALQDGCDAEEGEAEVKIPILYAVGHTWRARIKVQ